MLQDVDAAHGGDILEQSTEIVFRVTGGYLFYHLAILAKTRSRASGKDASALTCRAHVASLANMSKMIQLRHVPDALHRQLKARAAMSGLPLSDFLIREVRKIAEQPTPEEMRERLLRRAPYRGKASPTDIVRDERDKR